MVTVMSSALTLTFLSSSQWGETAHSLDIWDIDQAYPVKMAFYYMALSHKNWELPNSRI